jgi:hypothetical protein
VTIVALTMTLRQRGQTTAACAALLTLGLVLLVHGSARAQAGDRWTQPVDISSPESAGNDLFGVVLCDSYQNLHIMWGKKHDQGSGIYYRTDASGGLSYPVDVLAMSTPLALRLSATISERDNAIHLVWQDQWVQGDVYYSRADLAEAANANGWARPQLLVPRVDAAQLVIDAAGELHLIYGVSHAGGVRNVVYNSRLVDGGSRLEEPAVIFDVVSEVPSFLGLAVDADPSDRLHVGITVRSQEYGVASELVYARSLDRGTTWEPHQVIASQSEATPNVSVLAPFAFGEDEIHLTWHDPRRMHMWSGDGGRTWTNPIEIVEMGAGFGGANVLAKDSAGQLHAVVATYGSVYSAQWDGHRWGRYMHMDERRMDPHGQRLVVCQGNQLHVVYDDRHGEETTVWYSSRSVNAPHIAQMPIPSTGQTGEPADGPSGAVPESPAALQAEEAITGPSPAFETAEPRTANPATPLLAGLGSVAILMAIVFGWLRSRGRRR